MDMPWWGWIVVGLALAGGASQTIEFNIPGIGTAHLHLDEEGSD